MRPIAEVPRSQPECCCCVKGRLIWGSFPNQNLRPGVVDHRLQCFQFCCCRRTACLPFQRGDLQVVGPRKILIARVGRDYRHVLRTVQQSGEVCIQRCQVSGEGCKVTVDRICWGQTAGRDRASAGASPRAVIACATAPACAIASSGSNHV